MKKTLNPKNQEIYDYMIEANVGIILSGKKIEPNCYSIIFNKKKDFSIFPIPLTQTNSADERRELLKMMGAILKKNKVKVDMFLLVTTAYVYKKEDKEKGTEAEPRECLIFSARDRLDNQRYSMFEINRKDNKLELRLMEDGDSKGWKTKAEMAKEHKNFTDSLLTSIWKEYRKLK